MKEKLRRFFDILYSEFNLSLKEIELIFINFDVIECLLKKDFLSISDISGVILKCRNITRSKLFNLEKGKIVSSNRVCRRKFFTIIIDRNILEKFRKYCYCNRCGKILGSNVAIHDNIMYEKKFYCSKRCKRLANQN